jgi:protease-4
MLPNIEALAEKLSLHFEGVETHPFAGSFSLARAKTPEELRQIRALGAQTYEDFLQLVSVNRELPRGQLLPLAEGRIWSGTAAVGNGLVDELGGLYSAVHRAADLAGIGDGYTVVERPERLTLEQQIEKLLMGTGVFRPSKPGQLSAFTRDLEREIRHLGALNDPHGQYAILPYALRIN